MFVRHSNTRLLLGVTYMIAARTSSALLLVGFSVGCSTTYRAVGPKENQAVHETRSLQIDDVTRDLLAYQLTHQLDSPKLKAKFLPADGAIQDALNKPRALMAVRELDSQRRDDVRSSLLRRSDAFEVIGDIEKSSVATPELYGHAAYLRRIHAQADFTQSSYGGALPSLFRAFDSTNKPIVTTSALTQDSGGGTSAAVPTLETANDVFGKLLQELQSNNGVNLATIANGGRYAEVATTDVLHVGAQGENLSTFQAIQFVATAGTVVVDQTAQGQAGFAGSVGLRMPIQESGWIGIGYGAYRTGSDWTSGLYVSISLAGGKPVQNH